AGQVQILAARSLGVPLYLGLFGWLGTSIHEIGHAIFHSLFGHRIVEFRPYKPDPSGTLGYVKFTYNQNSLYQQIGMFFAAIGPILFGTLFIFLASLFLIEPNILQFIGSVGINTDSLSVSSGFTGLLKDILSYSLSVVGFLFQPAHFVDW